ncbi:carbohydrate ABC transporter permease [Paenibacillus sp. J5C_2022]|uniref:carbohydrate ABC transporter permease n=1 Tax=Paenibacillus sp. J5C2022 TaxID=2977129 RepID=UPI0021D34951|nr:carbohydrate ABC transporter permease [Paenibacillus sp. J5C2022]MCU6709833.1 carbohydrate ABC transporter permease [Paenibacillus sp. J5C2022]
MKESQIQTGFRYVSLMVLMLFTLLPFLWLIDTTFKTDTEMFASVPSWLIQKPTWEHYGWALTDHGLQLGRLLLNSVVVCAVTALATGLVACISGYGLARHRVPGVSLVVVLIVLAQMIQGPLIMIPWYKMAASLSLLNTKTVLVLIYGTLTIPVGVWIMSGFFKTIPIELEEAAHMDGAGRLRTLFTVIIPLALPGLIAVSLYAFILGWNDYQYSLILTNSISAKTVQVGIAELLESLGSTNWGGLLASGVIVILPIIVIFALIQKFLIEGMTAGSVKG